MIGRQELGSDAMWNGRALCGERPAVSRMDESVRISR